MADNQTPAAGQRPPRQEHPADPFNLDFSSVVSSLQRSLDQMRQTAQQEMERLRTEHDDERNRLQGEIQDLRRRCNSQDERLRDMQGQIKSLMSDYRADLEGRITQADDAKGQLDRVQQMLNALDAAPQEEIGASDGSITPSRPFRIEAPRRSFSPGDRRGSVLGAAEAAAPAASGEETVQMQPSAPATNTLQISIRGVDSVSAMMRARKAVEGLPAVVNVESRYVSDGTLFFTVRAHGSAQELADALAALPDPTLRKTKVSEDAVELEM